MRRRMGSSGAWWLVSSLLGLGLVLGSAVGSPELTSRASGEARPLRVQGLDQGEVRLYLPWVARRDREAPRVEERVGGTTRALVARGDRVYGGIDDRVLAFDVSGAREFGPVAGSVSLGANIHALALDGDRLYAAAGPTGLFVLEVAEDSLAVERGMDLGGKAHALQVHAGHLLVAFEGASDTGLLVLELRAGASPREVARVAGGCAMAMDLREDVLFLSGLRGGADALDVSDPATPRALSTGSGRSCDPRPESEGPWWVGLAAGNELLMRSAAFGEEPFGDSFLEYTEIRDPAGIPGEAGAGGALSAVARDVRHYSGTWFLPIAPGDEPSSGLVLIDEEDEGLGSPRLLDLPDGMWAVAVDAEARRLYAGGARINLVAFDLSDPREPVETARYWNVAGAGRVAAGRDQVYVIEEDPMAMGIVATDGPWPARRVGAFPLTAEDLAPDRVTLLADPGRRYAYLLYYNALQVVEATAPDAPAARRLLAMPDITTMAMDDRWIYGAGDGLRIIDVFVQDDPRQLAYVRQAGAAEAVAVEGQRAYVAQKEPTSGRPTSLYVWDVSDRSAPRRVGQLADIGPTVGLAALGGYVWQLFDYQGVAGQQARGAALVTIDARNPAAAGEVAGSRLVFEGRPRKVLRDASVGRVYVLEESWFDRRTRQQRGRDGVYVLDVRRPDRPRLVDFVAASPPPRDIDAREGKLYLAGEDGLSIVDPSLR